MDPVTAFGLAANIVQFVVWGAHFVDNARQVIKSGEGMASQTKTWLDFATESQRFSNKLIPPDPSRLMGDEKALCNLATQCREISGSITALLDKIKPKDSKAKMQVIWSMLKAKHYESDVNELQDSLDLCQGQLHMQLSWLTQFVQSSRFLRVFNADLMKEVVGELDQPDGYQAYPVSNPT
jgi:hypothetical protein